MLPAITYRKWAREYLARAQRAQTRHDQVRMLQMAVKNSVRAQEVESDSAGNGMDDVPARDGVRKQG